jgi:porphobilinogen synthase
MLELPHSLRLRRLRRHPTLRRMLAGVRLSADELIAPLFVHQQLSAPREIPSLPGHYQHSLDSALDTIRRWADRGLGAVLLFGIPARKDDRGTGAWDDAGAVQKLTGRIKQALPHVVVIADVCLCEYTDHGHCGLLKTGRDGAAEVDNDATLELLARTAVSHARAGADIVAPSAMMDHQVRAIRQGLDADGFADTAILSYAVKYASSFYGPFREAAQSAPREGGRRGYQMDYANARQPMLEALSDLQEGADMLMVKPAAAYLDVIHRIRQRVDVPLAAYHVSGEYACLKAAARAGWLDEKAAVLEVTTAIKRAGADLIITYYAEDLAQWL